MTLRRLFPTRPIRDRLLRLPATSPNSLYWPQVGLYDFATVTRLPVTRGEAAVGRDHLTLPPIKVVSRRAPRPAQPLTVRVGDFATLLGYDLSHGATPQRPATPLTVLPGDTLTLTLYFRGEATPAQGYTRFVQLVSADHGLLAQHDSPPRHGSNPTWSWVAGEIIHDPAQLVIPSTAPAGSYTLYTGLYDPATGARVPLTDAQGQPLPDAWLPLTQITLAP